jgi:two-component system chemotaxis response regulator CheB
MANIRKIRVLVVDDSVVIRRLLSDILTQDPQVEVVGTASNGRIALQKLTQLCPDIITLDIEMPDLDGLATLSELRKIYPKLPVIMFSTMTSRGAISTLDALGRGATDYVTKPANVGSVSAGMESVKDQLLPKIKALCPFIQPPGVVPSKLINSGMPGVRTAASKRPFDVLVIGSSTGGPQALSTVLKELPATIPVPIAIVQHMPPVFTRHLADRLNQESALTVKEAEGGETLEPGQVLIAPGDRHLELQREGLAVKAVLSQAPPDNSCRPAVDVLFRTAAAAYQSGCLAAVLTGMGQDGLRGGEEVVRAGGMLIAQDRASSVVWGMPRAVAEAGLTSYVLPLSSVAREVLRITDIGRRLLVTS